MYIRGGNSQYKSNKSLNQPEQKKKEIKFEIEKNYNIFLPALEIDKTQVLGKGAFAEILKGSYYGKPVAVKKFDLRISKTHESITRELKVL